MKLRKLAPTLDKNLAKAVIKGGEDVVKTARSLAPVGRTGRLRDSITVNLGVKDGSVTVEAGSGTAYYARWVEFGTAPHIQGGKFAGTQHPGTSPQPFFFPAFRLNKKRISRRIARAINTSAKQVAGKK